MAAGVPDPLVAGIEGLGTIDGRFDKIRILGNTGQGHFSLLFSAIDLTTGLPVALKFLHPQFNGNPYRRLCFTREAQLLGRLRGKENILQLIQDEKAIQISTVWPGGAVIPTDLYYFATELAEVSFRDYIYGGNVYPILKSSTVSRSM